MKITTYQSCYKEDAIALLAELQDHERQLLPHMMPTGAEVAEASFDYLSQQCQNHHGQIYLAIDNNKAVGLLGIYIEEDDVPHVKPAYRRYPYISELVVSKGYRGQGIAQQLMQQAEAYGQTFKLPLIRLSALAKNEATCDFYTLQGYQQEEIVFTKGL